MALAVSLPVAGRGTASPVLKAGLMMSKGAATGNQSIRSADGVTPGERYVAVVIEMEGEATEVPDYAEELSRRGELVVVSLPVSKLDELLSAPGVLRMESGVCATPAMDEARTMCQLKDAYTLPGHFRGANVVVGFTDIGFDPNHINFLDTDHGTGNSRVKRLINYTDRQLLPTRLTQADEIAAWHTDTDQEWHATHVAGILAGSYAPNNFYGVAPEAEIVATTSPLADGYLLAGCEEVISYARDQGKPAVINMSIASSTGSHDGTSLFNRYMERLAEDAVVCISSGNSGDKWSAHIPFPSTIEKPKIQTAFREYPHKTPFAVKGIVDMWSTTDARFTTTLLVYDSEKHEIAALIPTTGLANGDGTAIIATPDIAAVHGVQHDPQISSMFESALIVVSCEANPYNNRFNTVISFDWTNKAEENLPHGRYWLGVEVATEPGNSVELYASNDIEFMRIGGDFVPDFSISKSINDLACGHGIVSVGAIGDKTYLDTPDNELPVAWFSSFGELNDGRLLPTICAPGSHVVSSVSTPYILAHPDTQYAWVINTQGREYFWDSSTGTSMASPYTAGVFALMLDANPDLTPAEAIAIVRSTATTPLQKKPQWGGGILNAYEALKQAIDMAGIASVAPDAYQPIDITPRGGNRYDIAAYGADIENITVTDVAGRITATYRPSGDSATIDLCGLHTGAYILTATTPTKSATAKIIVR